MSQKSYRGLWILFAMALLTFLGGKIFAMLKPGSGAKPKRNNNPFSIVQKNPDNWIGLVGKDDGDFLTFDSPVNGTRAGFVNLYNRYFKLGLNSIAKIGAIYPGIGAGDAWTNGVSSISGLPATKTLTWSNAKQLGRAIEKFENGTQWVSDSDWNKGYDLAQAYTGAK